MKYAKLLFVPSGIFVVADKDLTDIKWNLSDFPKMKWTASNQRYNLTLQTVDRGIWEGGEGGAVQGALETCFKPPCHLTPTTSSPTSCTKLTRV